MSVDGARARRTNAGGARAGAGVMSTSARARMFFALPLDDALDAVAPLVPWVVDEAQGRVVAAHNLHATLAFVGDVGRDRLDDLERIGNALPTTGVTLALDTVGSFRGARVAWLGASVLPPALMALHRALDAHLRAGGFRVEERPYHPHVTLARHCRRALAPRPVASIAWIVRRVALYESISAEEGPRYEPRASWLLDAAG